MIRNRLLLAILTVMIAALAAPTFASVDVDTPATESPLFVEKAVGLEDEVDADEFSSATMLPSSYSTFDLNRRLGFGLQADPDDGDVESVSAGDDDAMMDGEIQKNPGRALLLSAILPGAGELYAGKPWRAAGFFALELASWVGAVYYAQQGEDKEVEYETFADNHYREDIYRTVEYQAAVDPNANPNGEGYDDTQAAWERERWQDKLRYLPGNFTHELVLDRDQSWYENVGKYLTQFGYGWEDYVDGRPAQEIVTQAQTWGYIWSGESPLVREYIDMRDESNQLLDRSATFFSVIMVNHVVSALHAGFTVRAMNQDLEVEPEARRILHNDELVHTAGVRIRF